MEVIMNKSSAFKVNLMGIINSINFAALRVAICCLLLSLPEVIISAETHMTAGPNNFIDEVFTNQPWSVSQQLDIEQNITIADDRLREFIVHKVLPGNVVDSGKVVMTVTNVLEGSINPSQTKKAEITFDYKVVPKWYLPYPVQEGKIVEKLPYEALEQSFYQNLEENGVYQNDDAEVTFLRRETAKIGGKTYQNCYVIKVVPSSKKWSAIGWYHPSLKSIGWVKSQIYFVIDPIGETRVDSEYVSGGKEREIF